LKCLICEREFGSHSGLSRHIIKIHCPIKEYYDNFLKEKDGGFCKTCGSNTNFASLKNGYNKFCSNLCMVNNNEVKEKIKSTCLKNNGVEYSIQSPKIRMKAKSTCLQKFGCENANQAMIIKEKKKETSLIHFGTDYPMQSKEIQNKVKTTCLKKYGVNCSFQADEIENRIRKYMLKNTDMNGGVKLLMGKNY